MPRSGIAGFYGSFFFLRNPHTVPHSDYTSQQGINLQNIPTALEAPYKKWVEDLNRHFFREDMAKSHIKDTQHN